MSDRRRQVELDLAGRPVANEGHDLTADFIERLDKPFALDRTR